MRAGSTLRIAHSRSLWHQINAGIGKHHGTELAGLPCHDEARLGVLERLHGLVTPLDFEFPVKNE